MIENYWPGTSRVGVLRRHWPSYKAWWDIIDMVNRFPAPKPVTRHQCRLMASYLGLRRPRDIGPVTKIAGRIGPETHALRVRNRGAGVTPLYGHEPVKPESEKKLRKVGRKPLRRAPKRKMPLPIASEGLSAVGSRSWRLQAVRLRPRGKRSPGKGRKARRKSGEKK